MGPFLMLGVGIALLWEKASSLKKGALIGRAGLLIVLIPLFFSLGIITMKQIGIWKDSLTFWNYEVNRFPEYWKAYYNRAHTYASQGDYGQALKDLEKAIIYKPQYLQSYFIRGLSYAGLKDYQNALKDLNTVITHDPQFARAYFIRAQVFIILEEYQAALKDLDAVIKLKHEFVAEAELKKTEILQQTGSKD